MFLNARQKAQKLDKALALMLLLLLTSFAG